MAEEKKFEAKIQGFDLTVVTPDVVVRNNVDKLVEFIGERIKDYSPEKYMGDADMAKKDRTELNKGAEQVKSVRQSIEALNPYGDVIQSLKDAEKVIKGGADALAVIVKNKETEEKEAKKALIQTEWDSRSFSLFPLERVFNPKWLNKTYKMTDIANEMTSVIDRVYKDLKTIEGVGGSDTDTLKAHYLTCLDVGETMRYYEDLKRNREIAAREQEERVEREHNQRIEEQKQLVREEQKDFSKKSAMSGLVADALEEERQEPEIGEYTISVKVTESQLIGIKNYLNAQGVEYECNKLDF